MAASRTKRGMSRPRLRPRLSVCVVEGGGDGVGSDDDSEGSVVRTGEDGGGEEVMDDSVISVGVVEDLGAMMEDSKVCEGLGC